MAAAAPPTSRRSWEAVSELESEFSAAKKDSWPQEARTEWTKLTKKLFERIREVQDERESEISGLEATVSALTEKLKGFPPLGVQHPYPFVEMPQGRGGGSPSPISVWAPFKLEPTPNLRGNTPSISPPVVGTENWASYPFYRDYTTSPHLSLPKGMPVAPQDISQMHIDFARAGTPPQYMGIPPQPQPSPPHMIAPPADPNRDSSQEQSEEAGAIAHQGDAAAQLKKDAQVSPLRAAPPLIHRRPTPGAMVAPTRPEPVRVGAQKSDKGSASPPPASNIAPLPGSQAQTASEEREAGGAPAGAGEEVGTSAGSQPSGRLSAKIRPPLSPHSNAFRPAASSHGRGMPLPSAGRGAMLAGPLMHGGGRRRMSSLGSSFGFSSGLSSRPESREHAGILGVSPPPPHVVASLMTPPPRPHTQHGMFGNGPPNNKGNSQYHHSGPPGPQPPIMMNNRPYEGHDGQYGHDGPAHYQEGNYDGSGPQYHHGGPNYGPEGHVPHHMMMPLPGHYEDHGPHGGPYQHMYPPNQYGGPPHHHGAMGQMMPHSGPYGGPGPYGMMGRQGGPGHAYEAPHEQEPAPDAREAHAWGLLLEPTPTNAVDEDCTVMFDFPRDAVGYVHGAQRSTISHIQNSTRTSIGIDQAPRDPRVTIQGTRRGCIVAAMKTMASVDQKIPFGFFTRYLNRFVPTAVYDAAHAGLDGKSVADWVSQTRKAEPKVERELSVPFSVYSNSAAGWTVHALLLGLTARRLTCGRGFAAIRALASSSNCEIEFADCTLLFLGPQRARMTAVDFFLMSLCAASAKPRKVGPHHPPCSLNLSALGEAEAEIVSQRGVSTEKAAEMMSQAMLSSSAILGHPIPGCQEVSEGTPYLAYTRSMCFLSGGPALLRGAHTRSDCSVLDLWTARDATPPLLDVIRAIDSNYSPDVSRDSMVVMWPMTAAALAVLRALTDMSFAPAAAVADAVRENVENSKASSAEGVVTEKNRQQRASEERPGPKDVVVRVVVMSLKSRTACANAIQELAQRYAVNCLTPSAGTDGKKAPRQFG